MSFQDWQLKFKKKYVGVKLESLSNVKSMKSIGLTCILDTVIWSEHHSCFQYYIHIYIIFFPRYIYSFYFSSLSSPILYIRFIYEELYRNHSAFDGEELGRKLQSPYPSILQSKIRQLSWGSKNRLDGLNQTVHVMTENSTLSRNNKIIKIKN